MTKVVTIVELDTDAFGDTSSPIEQTTWRFCEATEYFPRSIDAIPSIAGVDYQSAIVSLGEDLGQRASLTVTFKDHKHVMNGESFDSGTFFGKFRARYGQKLRGREIRLIRGTSVDALEGMETRHFFVESTDGPTPDGVYTIVAKDLLKFADDKRSLAPVLSNGKLAGSIDADDTAVSLLPTGIGNLEYPASGHLCLGGKEVVSFTRTNDALTLTRAQLGSPATSHNSGDRAQIVLYYDGDDVADIIADLFINYAAMPSECIPLTDWQAETAANLGGVIYARAITEPTAVNKLVSELVAQAALAVWYDERARLVRLQVLKEIATDAAVWTEDLILDGTLKVKDQPDKRISQVWTRYGQHNPADRGDDEDNYRASLALVDLPKEAEYGGPKIRTITGAWIATETAADRLNQIHLSRFRDPPRRFNFDLFRGADIAAAGGYRIRWRQNQDVTGAIVEEGAPIQVTRVSVDPGVIHVEAEEMLASGVIVLRHTVLLTTTGSVLSWTVPDSWNDADNIVECIGGGGGGGCGSFLGVGAAAGGGGAYAAVTNLNLTPAGSVSYRVGSGGAGGSGGATNGTSGSDTWFNGASFGAASVGAKAGEGGTGQSGNPGGSALSSIGTVRFSGGTGGDGGPQFGGGGGAGAAAGPHGDGGHGGNGATGNSASGAGGGGGGADDGSNGGDANGGAVENAGLGGNNRFGFGRGTPSNPHGTSGGGGCGNGEVDDSGEVGNGSSEELWTQTIAPIFSAGPGSGPGGGGERSNGKNGALYGAAGSGSGGRGTLGGNGAKGVIAISWTVAS